MGVCDFMHAEVSGLHQQQLKKMLSVDFTCFTEPLVGSCQVIGISCLMARAATKDS